MILIPARLRPLATVLLALASQLLPAGTPYRIAPEVLRAWGWVMLAADRQAGFGRLIRGDTRCHRRRPR